jgi:hypothetical protein
MRLHRQVSQHQIHCSQTRHRRYLPLPRSIRTRRRRRRKRTTQKRPRRAWAPLQSPTTRTPSLWRARETPYSAQTPTCQIHQTRRAWRQMQIDQSPLRRRRLLTVRHWHLQTHLSSRTSVRCSALRPMPMRRGAWIRATCPGLLPRRNQVGAGRSGSSRRRGGNERPIVSARSRTSFWGRIGLVG